MWNPKLPLIDVVSRAEVDSSLDSVDSVGFSGFLVESQSSNSSLRSTQTCGLKREKNVLLERYDIYEKLIS